MNITALQEAAIDGKITTLKSLRANGVSMSLTNYDMKTPLHYSAEFGQLATVQYLVSAGANINAKDRWGATPLTYAVGYPNITQYLLSQNATNGTDIGNFTVLLRAYSESKMNSSDYISFYAAYNNDVATLVTL